MGKLATVVYDAKKHVPLIVRTRTSSPSERCGVFDAVAAFAHHCESLKGIARSNVHISALWGGPPFVTYQVVQGRFRVIVMWVDAPGEFDVAPDVEDALIRLHGAVSSVADGIVEGDESAIAHAYTVAGAVLEDDIAHALLISSAGAPPIPEKSSKLPLKKLGSDSAHSSSGTESKKGGFLRGLLGGGGGKSKRGGAGGSSEATTTSQSDLRGDSNILAVVESSAETPFDEPVEGDLDLPEEVFAFSDFGAPLPQSAGDLSWVAKLIQGQEKPKSMPRPATLHKGPSSEDPMSPSTLLTALPSATDAGPSGLPRGLPAGTAGTGQPPQPQQRVTGQEPSSSRPPVLPQSTPLPSLPATPTQPAPAPVIMAGPTPPSPTVKTPPPPPPMRPAVPPQQAIGSGSSVLPAPILPAPVEEPQIPEQLKNQEGDDFDVSALGVVRDEATIQDGVGAADGSVGGHSQASLPAATTAAIRNRMNEFANTMQSGNYPLALQQVTRTLAGLGKISPRPEREIIACASYFQALQILIRVRVLEAEMATVIPNSNEAIRRSVEMALLTMFLAESKNLLPRHLVAGKKMAVEKNIVVGNFGMSARWLRSLVEAAPPPQKSAFAQRLQLCVQSRELNAHMPPSKFLCFKTLNVLSPGKGIKCSFCPGVFSPGSGVAIGQTCPVCHLGTTVTMA